MIDAVLVTELSHCRRSTQDLLGTLLRFAGSNVSLVAMSGMMFELDTLHGRMMAMIAQFKRDLLIERMKSGLVTTRVRDRKRRHQPKSDWATPKALWTIAHGRSYAWVSRNLGIFKYPVADMVKRHRNELFAMLFHPLTGSTG